MKAQFTPGPWKIFKHPAPDCSVRSIGTEESDFHCAFASVYLNVKANAALIAAAPDLLAALESILRSAEPMNDGLHAVNSESIEAGRVAIAKVRGEIT